MTEDGNVEYETITEVALKSGQARVKVKARDVEENNSGVEANALTVITKPIAGIVGVTNLSSASIASEDESDNELRERAKNFLHGSERATLSAIQEAVVRQGIQADVYEVVGQPGFVEVVPHVENMSDELQKRVEKAIHDARPAGVKVSLVTSVVPLKINLRLRIDTATSLLEAELRGIQDSIHEQIDDYFASLPVKENGSVNKVIGMVLGVADVQDMQILSVTDAADVPLDFSSGSLGLAGQTTMLGDLEIIDPNLPTRVQIVIAAPPEADLVDEPVVDDALSVVMASLNELNLDGAHLVQQFSFQQLLYLLPLPVGGKSGGTLENLQANPATIWPDAAAVAPYEVQFVFTQENGLSQALSADGQVYPIAAFERISYDGLSVTELV